jgi:hypothetical protein
VEGWSLSGRATKARRLAAPRGLRVVALSAAGAALKWTAPKGKPSHYVVLRDGKSIGRTTKLSFTDTKVKPGKTYRYAVRAFAAKRAGALSPSVRVRIPKAAPKIQGPTTNTVPPIADIGNVFTDPLADPRDGLSQPPGPAGDPTPTPSPTPTASPTASPNPSPSPSPSPSASPSPSPSPSSSPSPSPSPSPTASPSPSPSPTPTPPDEVVMTPAMVDRLFWRAGFGPSAAHRAAWTGMRVGQLVDFLVNTPAEAPPAVDGHPTADLLAIYTAYYATQARPPKDSGGDVIDPNASDTELELEWIDRMQRAANPLPDRLAFFWHRHWAISRDDGIANHLILQYRNRLLRYADFGAYPNATFRDMAFEMTTKDAAMSQYLNINQNVKSKPNENYARELMELFCLGPNAPDGRPNYSQKDVAELARALTGWSFHLMCTVAPYCCS